LRHLCPTLDGRRRDARHGQQQAIERDVDALLLACPNADRTLSYLGVALDDETAEPVLIQDELA
jgi:hypothetical protein